MDETAGVQSGEQKTDEYSSCKRLQKTDEPLKRTSSRIVNIERKYT